MHQLLFFDTFSHDSLAVAGTGELNLDLVQFPSPVYVSEVRVIPLGSKVKANFPGGVRLGATNPNKFDLEFFVNNLKAPGASTFESIGVLQYNHAGCISLATSQDIATDGLVLRGLYSTITLAVYGTVSDSTPDQLARQGNSVTRPVKEEPGVTPDLSLPLGPIVPSSDNGRTLGESYAAQWTEKHSQQALKAEPPDGWGEVLGVKVEAVKDEKSNGRYEEGAQYRTKGERDMRQTPERQGPQSPRDIKREGLSPRDKLLSPKHDRSWNRYSDGYRSNSRDRSRNGSRDRGRSPRTRDRSPRDRDKSPGVRSDRARSVDKRARTPEGRDRTPKPRDRSISRERTTRSLSRERTRTPTRRDRSRTPGLSRHYSKSREASLDKRSFRSVSRDHDRGTSKDRFRSSSSLNRDTRDSFRPSTPTRERYRDSLDRSDRSGHKEGPNSDSRRPLRSPRSRDRSPRDYDKTSLHSSGSRRPLSPRSSPRRRSSLSPSPRFRRDRSRSPRSSSPSRRSRSPRKRSFSPGIGIGLAPYGSPIPSLSGGTTHRSPDRNGFKSPGGDLTPIKDGNVSPLKEDILDNVSDISEGDIPDIPEPEVEEPESMDVIDNNFEDETLSTIRSSIAREDVEEISDEEAEWSDDVETGGFSDYEMDLGEDWEDPIKYFDITDVELTPLTTFIDPTETIYECVKLNKVVHVASDRTLVDTIDALEHSDVDDKFVENIEHVTKVVQYELHSCESDSVIEKLVKVAFVSINFEKAMNQLKPTFKVRHIKSGLKLTMELLSCGDSVSKALLSANLQDQLLNLYTKEHMAMSIKLLILRTLDCTFNTMNGIKLFSDRGLYSKLIELSKGSQSTRTQFSFSSILTKLHLSEMLEQLVTVTSDTSDNSEVVSDILEQLMQIFKDLNLIMSQPARFLPSQSHFDLAGKQFGSPQAGYFCLMSAYSVVELLAFLITSPTTSDKEEVTSAVHSLVEAWLEDAGGLLYLANRTQQTNILARALLGDKVEEMKENETEEGREMMEDLDEGATTNLLLGSLLVHMVQAVRYLDVIQADISRADTVRKDMETREVHNAIISLYGMTFTAKGREALVSVITTGDNLDCLLTLIKHSSEEGKKDMKKSAIRGFASELLLLTIRTTDNVEFLQRYAVRLVELGKYDSHSKLAELVTWCVPLTDNTVFSEGGVVELTEVVKRNIEQVEEREQTKEGTLANELVTAVRILCHLVSPARDRTNTQPRSSSSQISEQMKYKYAAISMFSCDLVQHYTALLNRISLDHEQPHLHTATFVGNRGQTIISVIQPVIATLRRILEFVISCRDTEFRDLTVVGALLRTHTLLAVVPTTSVYYAQARVTSMELVQCLLAFTQPNVDLAKNNVGKSLWTQMMLEVITYVTSSPCAYMPGLSLLSELLPLPLPLPSPRQLAQQEELSLSTCRKLWSAHLHPLSPSLSKMVGVLACHSYPALHSLMQKVVEQLASLAPPSAMVVVTAVLDTITQLQSDTTHTSVLARLVMFLSWCLAQPSMKTVLCDKLTDMTYRTMVVSSLEAVLASPSPAPEHCVQAIHSLCDQTVTLRAETDSDQDSWLADSLPGRDSLSALVCLLLDHLATDSKNFSAHSLTVTTLTMLTEQEYTLAILKASLMTNNPTKERSLHSFLRKLAVEFSVSNPELLTCITSILSLLSSLVEQSSLCNGGPKVPSNTSLTLLELGVCVSWVCGEDTQQQAAERRRTHPLVVLNNRIKEVGTEHSEMQLTNTSVKLGELVTLLESLPADIQVPTTLDLAPVPLIPEPSTPIQLWSGKAVTVFAGDIPPSQLSAGYWLQGLDTMETEGTEKELVNVDLLGISQKYLAPLDLYSVAREVTKERTLATERKKKGVKKSLMETKALHNKNIISAFKDGRNVSIRGRGFARSAFRPDPFRTRPPNTSRPPSLHVDDFLVLELKGQQPTGPTGYNKQSIKAAKELFAQREAEAALKPPTLLREATREPVGQYTRGRGRGERGGRPFRGTNGSNRSFRRDSRGWSPEGFRTSEPRDLGRDARPGPRDGDRRGGGRGGGGFRGDRRGGGQWGERGGGGGVGRGERRFGRGGRGGEREDRPRHLRSLTR